MDGIQWCVITSVTQQAIVIKLEISSQNILGENQGNSTLLFLTSEQEVTTDRKWSIDGNSHLSSDQLKVEAFVGHQFGM